MSYTEAVEVLTKAHESGDCVFEEKPYWGIDFGKEHERYVCESHFKGPVFLYDYPKKMKAFYMRENDDKKTV
jgi:asparaginyl-tRNA synthetase